MTPKRLDPEFRATLIEFATERIQSVWNDVGETDAPTLAQNIVAAQEFAWMTLQVPVGAPNRETLAKALHDASWSQPPRTSEAFEFYLNRADALLASDVFGQTCGSSSND